MGFSVRFIVDNYFLIRSPPGMDSTPLVMPNEYEEFVTFLEGRRSLKKLMHKKKQDTCGQPSSSSCHDDITKNSTEDICSKL
jgi:hypothetical protein